MRVALVNNFFYPRLSGSSHLTEALAGGLARNGHEVLVLTSAQGAPVGEEERDGYRVLRLPCHALPAMPFAMRYDVNFALSPRNIRRVFAELDSFKPDIVHQHGQFFDLTWMSGIWARRRGVPSALTVHTALTHTTPAYAAALWLADEMVVRPFLRVAQPAVIVVDRFMRGYVQRRYHLPLADINVLPLAVDVDRFRPADGSADGNAHGNGVRTRLGIGDRPMILSLGHVIPLRDRLALVEATPRLLQHFPDLAIVVVGNVCDDRFLQRARALGVSEHFVLTGPVPYDEVPEYVAAADIEAHDLQGYGLGTASLEVMASGVPVVSVVHSDNFPGLELRNWEDVVIVPPDDPDALCQAFVRLLEDRTLARRVGEGQRRFIERHFSLRSTVECHEAFYEGLLAPSALASV